MGRLFSSKVIITTLLLWTLGFATYAQSKLFTAVPLTYASLTAAQKANYDKAVNQGVFSSIQFMNTDLSSVLNSKGILRIEVGNFLDSMVFKSFIVDYSTASDFSWSGKYFAGYDTVDYSEASLAINVRGGRIIGQIQSEDRSFQVYDLTGGVQILAEYDMSLFNEHECATVPGIPATPATHTDCGGSKTRILVIYTTAGAAIEPDLYGKAQLCINDLNRTWQHSNVYNTAELAGVEVVGSLTESSNTFYDKLIFSANTTVQSLRNTYEADIVIFLTKANYGPVNGEVVEIGGDFSQAYGIVTVPSATSGRHTFTHEVNHLYGARHDSDPTPGYAHGYTFGTGGFLGLFRHKRYTNLADMPSNRNRIEHLSNPNVSFQDEATGTTGTNFNAKKVNAYVQHIANFYDDSDPYYADLIMNGPAKCSQNGTATVEVHCGTAPYSYEWFFSDNGINWVGAALPNTTINTFVPLPYSTTSGIFNSRHYKVRVTDALGAVTWAANSAVYNCPIAHPSSPFSAMYLGSSANGNRMQVFPNPAKDEFNVIVSLAEQSDTKIVLVNNLGIVVETIHEGTLAKGENFFSGKCDQLPAGVYYIQARGAAIHSSQKLIIQP